MTLPDVAEPVAKPVPVQEVALDEDQVRVEPLPVVMEMGLALREAVGLAAMQPQPPQDGGVQAAPYEPQPDAELQDMLETYCCPGPHATPKAEQYAAIAPALVSV